MKKLLIGAAFVGASLIANAQVSIGPKIGFGLANIKESGDGASNETKGNIAPTIGLDSKIQFSDYFSIQPSLQLQVLGSKYDKNNYKIKTYLGYLQLPVRLNFQYPVNDDFTVGLGVGPYIGYYLGGGVQTPDNKDSDGFRVKGKSDVKVSDMTGDKVGFVNPLDLGLVIAPFFQVGVLQVAPTVSFGLKNVNPKFEGEKPKLVSKNLYYGLQVSLLFGGK